MATDPVVVATKPVTRQKLAQFLPNHELVKALENLTTDVGTTLPDAANATNDQITALQSQVSSLQSDIESLSGRTQVLEGEIASLTEEVANLIASVPDAAIGQIRAQLTIALRLIQDLHEGPRP